MNDLIIQHIGFEFFFYQVNPSGMNYSSGSGCPLPRREKVTTANAIATPIAAPYTAILASAIVLLSKHNK